MGDSGIIFIGAFSLIENNRAGTRAIAVGAACRDEYTRANRKYKQQEKT